MRPPSLPAVVFTAPGQVAVRSLDMPDPGPDQVQVRTRLSAISSGTEGWVLRDRFTWAPTPFPCVPGYQRVGTVTAVGARVTGWREGDRAMVTSGSWKGGPGPFWGAHAALANAGVDSLYRVPDGVDLADAAGAVVAQVGYNAASRVTLRPGDWVVVYGDGVIGQCGAQAARARGARTILVGHRPERLAAGGAHSADHALPDNAETVSRIRQLTGAEHVAVVIDTVQTPLCQQAYLPLLRPGSGQIVYSGFSPDEPWASMTQLHRRELTTHYIQGIARPRLEATLRLMAAGRMRLAPLITHRVPATRAAQIWTMIETRSEPFLGILFEW